VTGGVLFLLTYTHTHTHTRTSNPRALGSRTGEASRVGHWGWRTFLRNWLGGQNSESATNRRKYSDDGVTNGMFDTWCAYDGTPPQSRTLTLVCAHGVYCLSRNHFQSSLCPLPKRMSQTTYVNQCRVWITLHRGPHDSRNRTRDLLAKSKSVGTSGISRRSCIDVTSTVI
jgi:hypothetical protein